MEWIFTFKCPWIIKTKVFKYVWKSNFVKISSNNCSFLFDIIYKVSEFFLGFQLYFRFLNYFYF